MATCYICGKSHAEYRRVVSTGQANRIGYSRRGISTSTTSFSGPRCVCAQCALKIDYNNKKASVLSTFMYVLFLPIGIFCCFFNLSFGLIISILSVVLGITFSSIKKVKAEEWYENNKNSYIDNYEVQCCQNDVESFLNNQHKILVEFTSKLEKFCLYGNNLLLKTTNYNEIKSFINDCEKVLQEIENFKNNTTKSFDDFIEQLRNNYSDLQTFSSFVVNLNERKSSIFSAIEKSIPIIRDLLRRIDSSSNIDSNGLPLGYKTANVFDASYWNETFWQNVTPEQVESSDISNPNILYQNNSSALWFAASFSNNPLVIRALIQKGCTANLETQNGCDIAMSIMSANRPIEIMRELLSNNYNINKLAPNKNSLLTYSLQTNQSFDFIKLLFEFNADPNLLTEDGYSPLFFAINNSNVEIVNLLVNMGANINYNINNISILYYAVEHLNNSKIINFLCSKGLDINYISPDGNSVLGHACSIENNTENIEMLIKLGSDINYQNKKQQSPLWIALGVIDEEKICANAITLIKNGIDCSIADEQGVTPLMLACYKGVLEVIEILLANKVDVNIPDKSGQTSIMFSLNSKKYKEIIPLLINAGANLNTKKNDGVNVLMLALSRDLPLEIIKLIIDSGVDLNYEPEKGTTALILAVKKSSHVDVIEYLIKMGARTDVIDEEGKNLTQIALKNPNSEVIKLFMN